MKTYDKYKDSGVAWLGDVPEHWEVRRIKYLFTEINERSFEGNEDLLSVSQYTGVTKKSDKLSEGDLLTNAKTLEGYKKVSKNDLVSNIMLAWNGSLAFSDYNGITSPAYCIYRLNRPNDTRYFHYLLRTELYKSEFKRNSSGVIESRLRLYTDDFFKIFALLPPLKEQQTIANYLDNKTTKINQAIEQSNHLIALLKEQKQALIQKAVTGKWRMENGEWRMKSSGIEWIGEIPEHWEVKRLKYVFDKIRTGTTPSTAEKKYFDGNIDWYNPKDLNNEILQSSERKISQLAIEKGEIKIFKEKSILVVGIGATAGKTSYMLKKGTFNQQITGFNSSNNNNRYYYYLMSSLSDMFLKKANYTTLPILNNSFFNDIILVVPPLQEQEEIVNYLDTQTAKIDKAITLQENKISKLQEFKISLINSVVTGKVKVEEKKVWQ